MSKTNKAILEALVVTLLWSSSWVLIKFGLESIPALTFAGLRYTLGFLFLLPLLLSRGRRAEVRQLERRDWGSLILLGLVYYALTQGSMFVGLTLLPANTLSLILNFSGVSIALAGWIFLSERLGRLQWTGVAVCIAGALLYFGKAEGLLGAGLLVGLLTVAANTWGAILGRGVNRSAHIAPLLVTGISMGVGAAVLLAAGLLTEPFPSLNAGDMAIIVWLAAANTALAFTLWNHSLQTLSAAQSSVINNSMLIQIAILAWIFLGERPGSWQLVGLLIAAIGTALVQVMARPGLETEIPG